MILLGGGPRSISHSLYFLDKADMVCYKILTIPTDYVAEIVHYFTHNWPYDQNALGVDLYQL